MMVCAMFCCIACAGAQAKPESKAPVVPPPALLPPSAMPYNFQWRQHVTATWPTGTQSFDAVLQKQKGELTLVGLSPLGLPGFVFRLTASGELKVENRTGQKLPFEPAYVVADVERVFFPWLVPAPDGFSGKRGGQLGDVLVTERFEHGRLRERRFTRPTPAGSEQVVVRYLGYAAGQDKHEAPLRAALENQLLGYTLTIENIEQTRL
jgi:hypothetical protein